MTVWTGKRLGDNGERHAARFLKQQGFRILHRQYRSRLGEIDLVAQDGDCLVFVEVKTRRSDVAGHPVEAVTRAKQKKLTGLALHYLKSHGQLESRARFDVVAVIWPRQGRSVDVKHFPNAFPAIGDGQMFC